MSSIKFQQWQNINTTALQPTRENQDTFQDVLKFHSSNQISQTIWVLIS